MGEAFESELRRIIKERTDKTLDSIKNDPPDEAIHQTRKEFKKIRACWRLIRDDLGEDAYKTKNIFYRDLGRRLSDVRDSFAVIETVEDMRERYGNLIYKRVFDRAAKALQQRHDEIYGQQKLALISEVEESLRKNRKEINAFSLSTGFFDHIVQSTGRVYSRGYERYGELVSNRKKTILHTLRKRAKYLYYQFHILRGAWPNYYNTMEDEFHRLTDMLGGYMDMGLLIKYLKIVKEDIGELDLELYRSMAKGRQDDLYRHAMNLGRKLYAHEPGVFEEETETYLSGLIGDKEA